MSAVVHFIGMIEHAEADRRSVGCSIGAPVRSGVLFPLGSTRPTAPIAQSAEHLHGKEKVYGSIPYWGSDGVEWSSHVAESRGTSQEAG